MGECGAMAKEFKEKQE